MKFFINNYSYAGLIRALEKLGHQVMGRTGEPDEFNWWHHLVNLKRSNDEYDSILRRQIEEHKPDVFICGKGWHEGKMVKPGTVEWIRERVRCTVYWSLDDPDFVGFFSQLGMRRGYDVALTCCRKSVSDYQAMGMEAHLFWPAWDQEEWEPAPVVRDEDKASDFLIVGTPYLHTQIPRRDVAVNIVAAGMKLDLYGPEQWFDSEFGFPSLRDSYRGFFYGRQGLPRLFASSRINFSSHMHRALGYLNDRVPMVMGAGQFLMCDRQPGLEEEFQDGRHVVYFDSLPDLVAKAKFYLGRRELREEIGAAARERILEAHTYRHRAERLLRILAARGVED